MEYSKCDKKSVYALNPMWIFIWQLFHFQFYCSFKCKFRKGNKVGLARLLETKEHFHGLQKSASSVMVKADWFCIISFQKLKIYLRNSKFFSSLVALNEGILQKSCHKEVFLMEKLCPFKTWGKSMVVSEDSVSGMVFVIALFLFFFLYVIYINFVCMCIEN